MGDKECGSCKDNEAEGAAQAIAASLILPDYGTSYPKEDACWGISSVYSTSYQKFDSATTIDVAEARMEDTDGTDAITAYWRIFADNSCIGPSVGAAKMAVEEGTATGVDATVDLETGVAKATESGSAALVVTTTTVAATLMLLVLVGAL